MFSDRRLQRKFTRTRSLTREEHTPAVLCTWDGPVVGARPSRNRSDESEPDRCTEMGLVSARRTRAADWRQPSTKRRQRRATFAPRLATCGLYAPTGTVGGICRHSYSAYAEGSDRDQFAALSCGLTIVDCLHVRVSQR